MMLFDASALLNIIGEKGEESIKILKSGYISDLTFYEVGNAIWKSVYRDLITLDDAEVVLRTFEQLSTTMNVISCDRKELLDILKISTAESITFYDASYVHNAIKNDLNLVTDDKKLRTAASSYLKVLGSEDMNLNHIN
ncbi:MAG: type II toxin-antitoxin system VapC family toxin [Archaeoglobaceae archaeon]